MAYANQLIGSGRSISAAGREMMRLGLQTSEPNRTNLFKVQPTRARKNGNSHILHLNTVGRWSLSELRN